MSVLVSAFRSVELKVGRRALLALALIASLAAAGAANLQADDPAMPDMGMDVPQIENFSVLLMENENGWVYNFTGRLVNVPDPMGMNIEIYGGPFNATALCDDTGDFWINISHNSVNPVTGIDVYGTALDNGQPISNSSIISL